MILHIAKAGDEQNKMVLVMSTNTGLVIYNLAYFQSLKDKELNRCGFTSAQAKRKTIFLSI